MAFTFIVNGTQYPAEVEPETPFLWVLCDSIGLTITNACRCGTYHRVRQAIHRAAALRS